MRITDEMIERVAAAVHRAPTEAEAAKDRIIVEEVLKALAEPHGGPADRAEAFRCIRSSRDLAAEHGGTVGAMPVSAHDRLVRAALDELWPVEGDPR